MCARTTLSRPVFQLLPKVLKEKTSGEEHISAHTHTYTHTRVTRALKCRGYYKYFLNRIVDILNAVQRYPMPPLYTAPYTPFLPPQTILNGFFRFFCFEFSFCFGFVMCYDIRLRRDVPTYNYCHGIFRAKYIFRPIIGWRSLLL